MGGTAFARTAEVRSTASVNAEPTDRKGSFLTRAIVEPFKKVFVEPFAKETSPMKGIMAESRRHASGNKVMDMERALTKVLLAEGYSKTLDSEIRSLRQSNDNDDLFAAAINLFANDNGEVGDASGKLAQSMLNAGAVSGFLMESMLDYGMKVESNVLTRILSNSRKTGKIAEVMAKMCWRLRLESTEFVEEVRDSMEDFKSRGDEIQKRGAEAFFQALKNMESNVIEAHAVA